MQEIVQELKTTAFQLPCCSKQYLNMTLTLLNWNNAFVDKWKIDQKNSSNYVKWEFYEFLGTTPAPECFCIKKTSKDIYF
jgi:hypothetical protein